MTTILAFSVLISLALISSASQVMAAVGDAPKSNTISMKSTTLDFKQVTLFNFRDPDSKELIRVLYEPAPLTKLEEFKPSRVRYREEMARKRGTGAAAAAHVAKDFLTEWLAFTLAVGVSATVHNDSLPIPEMLKPYFPQSYDPAAAKNYVVQNADPGGFIGFMGFIAGSRASQAFLKATGLAFDPGRPLDYRIETGYKWGRPLLVPRIDPATGQLSVGSLPGRPVPDPFKLRVAGVPTTVQKIFSPLVGPMGLTTGMLASNVIHELIADKNLRVCASQYKQAPAGLSWEQWKQRDQAIIDGCDKFWEDWMMSRKIGDYMPDLMSMTAASLIEAYAVKKLGFGAVKVVSKHTFMGATKLAGVQVAEVATGATTKGLQIVAVREGAERFIPLVLRGIRIGAYTVGTTPLGRFAVTIGNIAMFMEIVHPITPMIKKPWERSRQSADITSRINDVMTELDRAEKNKWVWAPRPDSDFCTGFEADAMGTPTPGMNCNAPEQKDPAFLLKKMAERQAKWREFILQDAYLEHANWQSYVSRFGVMYANATAFYQEILGHVFESRFPPEADMKPSYLYSASPMNGLYTDPEQADPQTANDAIRRARLWLAKYLGQAQASGRKLHAIEAAKLPEILNGLRALDPLATPLASLGVADENFAKLTTSQKIELEKRVREKRIGFAMQMLRDVLEKDTAFNDRYVTFGTAAYEKESKRNPFMALRLLLGNPEPLPAGVGFIRRLNDEASIIEPESKNNHPDSIGRARTRTMAEYLLTSMACGPEADPNLSDEEKIQVYRDRKMSRFERTLEYFGLGRRPIKADDAKVLIAVNEYVQEVKEQSHPGKSWLPAGKNAITSQWRGFWADFHPPRVVNGVPASLCQTWADNADKNDSTFDPMTAKWKIKDEEFNGILDLVRKKARADIIGTSARPAGVGIPWVDPLQSWWSEKVDLHVVSMVTKFRASFRSILEEKYLPALTLAGPEGVIMVNNRSFKLGALAALYDEADLYLSILEKTTVTSKDPKAKKAFADLSAGVAREYRDVGTMMTDLKFVEERAQTAKAAYELKSKSLEAKVEELKAFLDARQKTTPATADVVQINEQVFRNLSALRGELESYWGVVRSIQVVNSTL